MGDRQGLGTRAGPVQHFPGQPPSSLAKQENVCFPDSGGWVVMLGDTHAQASPKTLSQSGLHQAFSRVFQEVLQGSPAENWRASHV